MSNYSKDYGQGQGTIHSEGQVKKNNAEFVVNMQVNKVEVKVKCKAIVR